ncbi:hypothetical protein [Ferruginibacter sp.]|nr:hypothetical protein [Ferruginibacter sp.]
MFKQRSGCTPNEYRLSN